MPNEPKALTSDSGVDPEQIEFRYRKGRSYRIVYCDGAFGGLTPRGLLRMALYTEHASIPDKGVRRLNRETMTLDPEVQIGSVGVYDREVEVDILMNQNTAREIHSWIGKYLNLLEKKS